MVATADVIGVIQRLARSRYGLITRDLSHAHGVSHAQLRRCVETGFLVPVHGRVLRLSTYPQSFEQSELALCLWAGDGWVAAGEGAARVWGLDGIRNPRPEIVGAGRVGRAPRSTIVREKAIILPGDVTSHRRIPITSAARTLIDVSPRLTADDLERATEAGIRKGYITSPYLMKRMALLKSRGRKGLPKLQKVLVRRGDAPPSDSDFEILLLQALRRYGVPEPHRQLEVYDRAGFISRVDYIYPRRKLILEADSRDHHFAFDDWEIDIAKRNRLVALGYRIHVVTWRGLHECPHLIGRQVMDAIAA